MSAIVTRPSGVATAPSRGSRAARAPFVVLVVGPVAALVAILVSLPDALPQAPGTTVPTWILWVALVALALGVPHGAVDQLALPTGARPRAGEALAYLALAAGAAVLVVVTPLPAFLAVVAMTVWHFGTGDVEASADLRGEPADTPVWNQLHALAAGCAPVLLPLTSSAAAATLALLEPALAPLGQLALAATIRGAVVVLVMVVVARLLHRGQRVRALELVLLMALGLLASPLLAFAAYFACWHSLRHTARLAQDQDGGLTSAALWHVVRAGLPALAVTALAVGAAVLIHASVTGGTAVLGSWLWLGLAAVWGLTVPHMLVVHRFDAGRRARRNATG